MPKLKSAAILIEDVTLLCPHCGENISEPFSGSHLWTLEDLFRVQGETVYCGCGEPAYVSGKPRPKMP